MTADLVKPGLSGTMLVALLLACGGDRHAMDRAILPPGLSSPAPEIRDDYAIEIDEERIDLTKAYFKEHNRWQYQLMPEENTVDAIRMEPRIVVVHYTAIPNLEETMAYFGPNRIHSDRSLVARSGALNVGIQFVVDRDGTIYRSYPEDVMSRHVIGLNHVAIGIENVGSADLGTRESQDKIPLTQAQLDANVRLIRYLAGKYPTIAYMIGHLEYRDLESPAHPAHHLFQEDKPSYRTEKHDPGPKFLKELRQRLKAAGSP